MSKLSWNEATTATLRAKADALSVPVISQEQVINIANEMGTETGKETSTRSISSKLRKEGYEVQKAVDAVKSPWSEENEAELVQFLNDHSGEFTYTEVAAAVAGGAFSAKQVQGKVLSLELTGAVKAAEKVVAARSYTPDEEATFVNLVQAGKTLEEIVAIFAGRNIKQIRGKALSLLREGRIEGMPIQSESTAKAREDVLKDLDIAELTVAEIAVKTNKTERGVKSMLSRRGLIAVDYDGAAKREKLDSRHEVKVED